MSVTHIKTSTSKEVHKELLIALGSENNPNQWLEFMACIKSHLPFLVGGTKPTKADYENSIIGALGFSSWAEMVHAPVENNGFNWFINTYNKWNQAYKVVLANPYLRDANMSPFQILKLKATFKDGLPDDLEALEQAEEELKAQAVKDKADNIAELKTLVTELESRIVEANAGLEVKSSENELLLLKLSNAGRANTGLSVELAKQRELNQELNVKLEVALKDNKALNNMSRFKCLKKVFAWK